MMELIDYLEYVEKRANDVHDVIEPLTYVYNSQKGSSITLDISIWNKIKELADKGK
jgi:hypothetical protein